MKENKLLLQRLKKYSKKDIVETLYWSCVEGKEEELFCIIENKLFLKFDNVKESINYALGCAAINKRKEIIKYLLSHDNLKSIIDIHTEKDIIFQRCVENIEIMHFVIFDCNIDLTDNIKLIIENEKTEANKVVKEMFEKRELNKNLNNVLERKNITTKINKV